MLKIWENSLKLLGLGLVLVRFGLVLRLGLSEKTSLNFAIYEGGEEKCRFSFWKNKPRLETAE